MVGFYSTIKRSCALIICVLPFACIDESGDYSTLPTHPVLKSLTISNGEDGSQRIVGDVVVLNNRMEIGWKKSGSFNPLPFHALPLRTTVVINNDKRITEMTTQFDGSGFTDFFEYDQQKRLSKARREDASNGIEYVATFFYRTGNASVDSISLELSVTANNQLTKQTGFFKKANASTYVSIFPFDKTQAYTLMDSYFDATSAFSESKNDLNKWFHTLTRQDMSWGEINWHVETKVRRSENEIQALQFRTDDDIVFHGTYQVYGDVSMYYSNGSAPIDNNNTSNPKYLNGGVGYFIFLAEYFPDPYLLNEVFYLIDKSKRVENQSYATYEINARYDWKE